MKHAPDMQHPLTDEFACELYHKTPRVVLEAAVTRPDGGWQPWEVTLPAAREFYRERARQLMAGDLSALPWTPPFGIDRVHGCGWGR